MKYSIGQSFKHKYDDADGYRIIGIEGHRSYSLKRNNGDIIKPVNEGTIDRLLKLIYHNKAGW